MTNHWKIELSSDPKVIGKAYPQVQKMSKGYDYDQPHGVYSISKFYQSLPDFIPNLDAFVLQGNAKLTDFLSNALISGKFVLINEKTKSILQDFILPLHTFYEAPLIVKGEKIMYYLFHYISDLTDYVDYPNSRFFIFQNYSTSLGYVEIVDKEDYFNKKQTLKDNNPGKTLSISSEVIKLIPTIPLSDFFEIGWFSSDIFISERLKNKLKEENITGVNFLPSAPFF